MYNNTVINCENNKFQKCTFEFYFILLFIIFTKMVIDKKQNALSPTRKTIFQTVGDNNLFLYRRSLLIFFNSDF
jgi:hypothetical protein